MREISRDPKTPASVNVRASAREPTTDPIVGVPLTLTAITPQPKHRLVAIGDSLAQGFQSGAIFRTDLSFPNLIARELGLGDKFRYPRYGGPGGLPLNIEHVVHRLEHKLGNRIAW